MKKNVLALSVATLIGGLGIAGSASADQVVNESGIGDILLVPYYTAQDSNWSVFHITNTDTVNGKAVKVRFRGASNSDDVLDFQVFLSPGDVWTGIVNKEQADGAASDVARLYSFDNSCTIPAIPAAGVDFRTFRVKGNAKAETLEGYVEVLTMADIPPATGGDSKIGHGNTLYPTIKHSNGVAPCNTAVLNNTLALRRDAGNGWDAALDAYRLKGSKTTVAGQGYDLVPPTGGLTGQWYIMNLDDNTTFSGAMTAIGREAGDVAWNVFSPQSEAVNAQLATADPLMQKGTVAAPTTPLINPVGYDVPDLSTPYLTVLGGNPVTPVVEDDAAEQAKAITASLLQTSVINQYATDVGFGAVTDWVFSMPTRRYTIAANYKETDTQKAAYKAINARVDNNLFSRAGNSTVNAAGQICARSAKVEFWDREENTFSPNPDEPVFSPSEQEAAAQFNMCGEVAVLSFAPTSSIHANLTRQNFDAAEQTAFENGWGEITFSRTEGAADNTIENTRVPVLGAALMKLTNSRVGAGVVANYGVTWPHAYRK